MRLTAARPWALIILSALLQVAIFPVAGPLPAWRAALCWFALSPLLLALKDRDAEGKPVSFKRALLLGYVCGILWYAGSCYWIFATMHRYGGLPQPVAFFILVCFSLYLGLYHALFAVLITVIRRSAPGVRGALLISPFAWVAVELARGRITGFPWDLLGYSQVDNLLLTRLAPIAGVMGISFVIAGINAAITLSLFERRRSRVAILVAAILIVCAVQLSRGIGPKQAMGRFSATLMQENLEVGVAGGAAESLTLPQELAVFAKASLHPAVPVAPQLGKARWSSASAGYGATVIVWPEAPSHILSYDPAFRAAMEKLARSANAAVIAGSLGVDRSDIARRGYFLYDSASLFDATGSYLGRYDKIHLVPWGEYVPFKEFFSFADKLTEGVGDMDRGDTRSVFQIGGHSYGVFVCYESIFGGEVREFAKHGAEVLVNISDDGWYGDSGAPWQHLNMARMRAIENDRWLLRATNTGITTAIDPQGRMEFEAPRHVRGAFAFPFDFTRGTTFYTRHGDWFAWLCAVVTMAFVGYSVRRGRDFAD